jgi:hypothetical protein
VKWDQPFLLVTDIFINISLLKKTILELGSSARWFVTKGAKGNLALHVGQGEQVTLIRLNDILVETGSGLGTKFITRVNVLSWGTLTSLVRGSAVQHGVGAAATTVEGAGLRIDKYFISRLDRWNRPLVLNYEETRLKLIRHLLLHKNINLTIGSATTSHTTTTSGTPDVPIPTETSESFELDTAGIGIAKAGITLTHRTVLGTIKPLRESRLVSWNLSHWIRNKLTLSDVSEILGMGSAGPPRIIRDTITDIAVYERLHTGVIASL